MLASVVWRAFIQTLLTGGIPDHHNAGDMLIERSDGGLKIGTPAKLNLFLEVHGKRADGYHELDTIMCPISLVDELTVHKSEKPGVVLELSLPEIDSEDPAWQIPGDERNLISRALSAVSSHSGYAGGWRVTVEKRIPAAAGMGGGSSDAAAAIVAGLVLGSGWNRELAQSIAGRLGSDISLFLGDPYNGIGLARATGRGEKIETLTGQPPLCFVVSHPPAGCSTAEVYKQWETGSELRSAERMLTICENARCPNTAQAAMACFETELANALQTPASRCTDWIARQLEMFASLGKPRAMMTGSGSACFALVKDLEQAQSIAQQLIELGLPRAYAATAWYADSIELQLDRIT